MRPDFAARSRMWYQRMLNGPDWLNWERLHPRHGRYRSVTLALGAWLFGVARRILTLPALVSLPAVLLVTFYTSLAGESPIRLLLLCFLSVLAVELLFGFVWRPRLEIQRRTPRRVRAGSRLTIRYRVRNLRRMRACNLHFDPFVFSRILTPDRPAELGELPPGETAEVEAEWTAVRRGVTALYRPLAESRFPLGLIQWSCRGRSAAERLAVYPAYRPLTHFALPLGAIGRSSGVAHAAKIGESLELLGSRDYRDGDDIRHLDWPGSARRGTLVVKEFEEERLRRVALVIDTCAPCGAWAKLRRRPVPELEAALSLAAALTEFMMRDEAVVDLFAAGDRVHRLRTGRNLSCFDAVCDLLAAVEPSSSPVLDRLEPTLLPEVGRVGGAVILLLGDDERRRAFVHRVAAAGAAVRVLVVGGEGGDLPVGWRRIAPEAVLAGRICDL